ncbi:SDR family oxidoreductase [Legionella israelensis]|uniref:UDP-glucose 4-epimerase family protein n=1 Tax=Legionella israelensis TaxID=454 RepID=UPI00117F7ECB|nr:SDR family oxidoreductase [Legionella israelensis]QDP72355.1 SDR family oxidoreductase [Legionella israelensis]
MTYKILITGATGFIGRRLVSQLKMQKKYFISIAIRQKKQDFFSSEVEKHFIDDIETTTDWSSILQNCDVIIHTAARVHIMNESEKDPLSEFRRVNKDGTLQLAKQAAANGVKRFIFISSIKVNGEETAINEIYKADDSVYPADPYAVSKYEAEQELLKLSAETGLEVVIIRPPLVYGPGVKGNFYYMLQWLKRGIPLPLGAIRNKRSLVYLDNLIDLIACCIEHPKATNQIFLVSDGEDLSTTELLKKISYSLGKTPRLLPIPSGLLKVAAILFGKKNLAQRLCGSLQVDISKTQTLLGWQPVVKTSEALKKTIREMD